MFGIGLDEIFVIIIVFLMFFNPREWPALARKIGGFTGWLSNEINDINAFLKEKKIDNAHIIEDEQEHHINNKNDKNVTKT